MNGPEGARVSRTAGERRHSTADIGDSVYDTTPEAATSLWRAEQSPRSCGEGTFPKAGERPGGKEPPARRACLGSPPHPSGKGLPGWPLVVTREFGSPVKAARRNPVARHALVCRRPSQWACSSAPHPEQEPKLSPASAAWTVPWLTGDRAAQGSPARASRQEPGGHRRAAHHTHTHTTGAHASSGTGAWGGIPCLASPAWRSWQVVLGAAAPTQERTSSGTGPKAEPLCGGGGQVTDNIPKVGRWRRAKSPKGFPYITDSGSRGRATVSLRLCFVSSQA